MTAPGAAPHVVERRRRVRFSKAFELLESNRPIKDVARSCGYESPSAFAFAFKREFGASPTDFREDWPRDG